MFWKRFVHISFLESLRMGSVRDTGSISLHQYYATDSACDVEQIRSIHLEEGKDNGK